MTTEQAIAATHTKWSHAPLCPHDVAERVALRLVDGPDLEVKVAGSYDQCPACRIFVRRGEKWRSRYVHEVSEVDAALDWCREVTA